ncbi:MAG: serine/threonine protein kinase [Planctomycetes bacterium]|nr:serine/threonine protein kinase [Planctomycetota bacterium]
MPAPASAQELLELGFRSRLLDPRAVSEFRQRHGSTALAEPPKQFADALVDDGLLTPFQASSLLAGKWRGFIINGKYRLLSRLGAGGMGSVYLCEHMFMRRRVALKVLPLKQAEDPDSLERFYLEARAVGCLDHPNIVRAHDVDHEGNVHFLVLEHIDGTNLYDLIRRHGPLSVERAANYIRQAAQGLQHAHEAGLVHRDIKPGNLLLDRAGVVKVLDMGLARFFNEPEANLSEDQEQGNVLGTADYLAPEQVNDSRVDIRADIYSLGVSFYYMLAGKSPFHKGTVAQKLIWHQVRRPKSIRTLRPDVPEGLEQVLVRMLDKDPGKRYQTPAEVDEALSPWTQAPIGPPREEEMPPPAWRSGPVSNSSASANLAPRNSHVSLGAPRVGTSSSMETVKDKGPNTPPAAKPAPAKLTPAPDAKKN